MFLLTTLPFMYCDAPSTVAAIRKPADATHAGAGSVTLASGANFEVTKDDDRFLVTLRRTDRVQLCYAPSQKFADAGPTARMAIAGNVRTRDYVYTLAYPVKAAATHAAAHAIVTAAYTMLVPTTFDGIALDATNKNVYVVKTVAADRYRIEVDLAPQCDGANVCSAGALSGYGASAFKNDFLTNPPDGPISNVARPQDGESSVKLANGGIAYYSETHSGAGGGGNSTLRWLQSGTLYVITSRPTTQAMLTATADTAILHSSSTASQPK